MNPEARTDRAAIAWRRGFFRLWVATTALWVALVGAIGFGAAVNPSVYVPDTALIFDVAHLPPKEVDTSSESYRAADEAARRGLFRHLTSDASGAATLHLFFSASIAKADMKAAGDYQIDKFNSQVAERRASARGQAIQMALAAALVPPAVLLGLGALLACN